MPQNYIPKEFSAGEVYLPPLLVSIGLGYFLAAFTMRLLGALDWHRHLYAPAVVEITLAVIYSIIISTFVVQG